MNASDTNDGWVVMSVRFRCTSFGDCCPDYEAICLGGVPTPPGAASCVGVCGGAGDGCFCDDL